MKTNGSFVVVVIGAIALLFMMLSTPHDGVAEAAPASPKILAAQRAFKLYEASYRAGNGSIESAYIWSRRWLDSERVPNRQAAKNHMARMQALEAEAKKRVAAGATTEADVAAAAFYVAEASELVSSP